MRISNTVVDCNIPKSRYNVNNELNTMQLYLKIEQSQDDCTGPFNPRFRQVTTNSEFTLGQALENVLDGVFENYVIIGPGTWVEWSTLAKELKGQQLTLLYQLPSENTDLKKTISLRSHYSRPADNSLRHEVYIDELKYPVLDTSFSSMKSDSNNVTTDCELDEELSQYNNKPSSSTLSMSSLDNNIREFTLDYETQTKAPVTNNTSSSQSKTLPDKSFRLPDHSDDLLSQPANIPHFSIISGEVVLDSHHSEVKQNNLSYHYQTHPPQNLESDVGVWESNPAPNHQWVALPNSVQVGIDVGSWNTMSTTESLTPQQEAHFTPTETTSCEDESIYVRPSFIETCFKNKIKQVEQTRPTIQQPFDQHCTLNHLIDTSRIKQDVENHSCQAEEHSKPQRNFFHHTPPPEQHLNLQQFEDTPPLHTKKPEPHYEHMNSPHLASVQERNQDEEKQYMQMTAPNSFNQAIANSSLFTPENQADLSEKYRFKHSRHHSSPGFFPENANLISNMQELRSSFSSKNSHHTQSPLEDNGGIPYTHVVPIFDTTPLSQNSHRYFDLFNPSHPNHDALGQPMNSRHSNKIARAGKNGMIKSYSSDDSHGYNYIDSVKLASHRKSLNIEDELSQIEGWKPKENGDTILKTIEPYRNREGHYLIWKSRRHQNFVLTISHQQQFIHLKINESKHANGKLYYIYENGYFSDSLLELINHYRINGIKTRVLAVGGNKIHNEHISLLKAIR
ncbi:uncharacterized protein LOC106050207 isoform X2 [Biomphalaria glabrata]|uniref:Uncharacterized protein LOC106050207 isoform X2 n=1 Tax=Biomphalaria glabrata TaxID=6526 RepID=A0A9W3A2C3_BIOGL|nr:uncharacterized protein LOC106050207 isoform X2 [Biomphalaria glabrata]